MLLVLAERADPLAGAVASAAGSREVVWLTPADVVRGRLAHGNATSSGVAAESWSLLVGGGGVLDLSRCTGVLNRVRWLPPPPFSRADDREYAAAEIHALMMSILHGVRSPTANPVSPPSLSGPALSTFEWLQAASSAGIQVRGMTVTTDGRRYLRNGWDAVAWQDVARVDGLSDDDSGGRRPRGDDSGGRRPRGDDSGGRRPRVEPGLPIGSRPVASLEPVRDVRSRWVVGSDVLGQHRSGDPDVRPLASAHRCPFLHVRLGETVDGRVVLCDVEPFPATAPASVARALALWLTDEVVAGQWLGRTPS